MKHSVQKSYETSLVRAFNIYCAKEGLTRQKAAKKFGVSYQFINRVLNLATACPDWLVPKFAKAFDMNEGLVGIILGHYPKEWETAIRKDPEKVHQLIDEFLEREGYRHKSPAVG